MTLRGSERNKQDNSKHHKSRRRCLSVAVLASYDDVGWEDKAKTSTIKQEASKNQVLEIGVGHEKKFEEDFTFSFLPLDVCKSLFDFYLFRPAPVPFVSHPFFHIRFLVLSCIDIDCRS